MTSTLRAPRRRSPRTCAAAIALVAIGLLVPLTTPPAAAAPPPGADRDGRWVWPLDPRPSVAQPFDPPESPWGAGNRGVDLFGFVGQPVRTIGAGEVTFAGLIAGRGVVVVTHGALRSTYEPVLATVAVGQQVVSGQQIGVLEAVGSHCGAAVCLHLGVLRGAAYLDPLSLLGEPSIRLKPIGGDGAPDLPVATSDASAVDAAVAAATHRWPDIR